MWRAERHGARGFDLRGSPALAFEPPRRVQIAGIPKPVSAPGANPASWTKERVPDGIRGTMRMLEKVAKLAVEASRDPQFIEEARGIVRPCAGRDYLCELQAILTAAKDGTDFRQDPYDTEYVSSPGYVWFVSGEEDCESLAGLCAAFDLSVGHGCRLLGLYLDPAMAKRNEFSHVYCEAGIRDGIPRDLGGAVDSSGVLWLAQDPVLPSGKLGDSVPRSRWLRAPEILEVGAP